MVTLTSDLDYADRYVAYLDILGFTDLTHLAHKDTSYRAFLRDIIRQTNAMFPKATELHNFRFIQFSDSIVLSAKQDREGLIVILRSVIILVKQMLERATLLRGGIALGNLHHDDEMMFGPAYLAALSFDKAGSGPHVGLMDHVIDGMGSGLWDDSIEFLIRPDPWDFTPMLHTLLDFEDYDATNFRPGTVPIHTQSVKLAAIIATRAVDMKAPAPVRAKWRWMQDYWNRTVAVKGILPRAEPSDWAAVEKQADQAQKQAVSDFNTKEREKRRLAGKAD